MKRKLISLMTTVTMLMSLISAMPLTASAADVSASSIKLGDYVTMGEYNGEKLLWRCVAFEKAMRQANGSVVIDSTQTNTKYQAVGENEGDVGYLPLMFADAIIGKKAFDADGGKTTGSHGRGKGRTDRGSSYWGDSNIRDWLNSADTTVSYSCGNAPEYKNEAGFLTNFNSAEKAAIQTVTQKAIISKCDWEVLDASKRSGYQAHTYTTTPVKDIVQNYSSAYSEQISDKMFLLDVQQLYNASVALGSYYIPSTDTQYLLRTPCCNTDHSARYVLSSGGSLDVYSAYNSTYGIRPAFFLDLSSVEFDGGDGAKDTPHTIPVPPHYHSLTHYDAVLPTCTKTGTGEYWKCEGDEGCGKYFSDENGETEIDGIPTVNATGHSLTKTEAQAATCTQEGNRTYWTCSGCNKLFSDENGTTETTLADTVIARTAHTEVAIPAVAATCTEKGKTAGVKCSVCDTILTAPTETAAKGHSWGDWITTKDATEAEDGLKESTCSACGERDTQIIPHLNHTCDWGDWEIKDAPTDYEPGWARRVCKTNANHTESAFLPVLTDTTVWTYEEIKAPTQDTDGEGKYTSAYGEIKITLPATGVDKFSIRYEGGNAIVTAPTAGTYAVLFAAYNADGRLTSLSVQPVTVEKGETTVAPKDNFTASGTVKVMLWESMLSMKPLCAADEQVSLAE